MCVTEDPRSPRLTHFDAVVNGHPNRLRIRRLPGMAHTIHGSRKLCGDSRPGDGELDVLSFLPTLNEKHVIYIKVFMPETPSWLISNDMELEAKDSLQTLRGK